MHLSGVLKIQMSENQSINQFFEGESLNNIFLAKWILNVSVKTATPPTMYPNLFISKFSHIYGPWFAFIHFVSLYEYE